jgi:hypothetical protein
MHRDGDERRLLGCGADRRQIADELWAAFKDRWTGERKYALRIIVKHLKGEQDAVDTPTDPNERSVADLHYLELYETLEQCTADMWEIAPRLEAHEVMICMEANN